MLSTTAPSPSPTPIISLPLVANCWGKGNIPRLQANRFASRDTTNDFQGIQGKILFVTKADEQQVSCGDGPCGWLEKDCLSKLSNEFATVPQGRKQSA